MRKPKLKPEQILNICVLLEKGSSDRQIAKSVGVDRSTVRHYRLEIGSDQAYRLRLLEQAKKHVERAKLELREAQVTYSNLLKIYGGK